jgi:pullulanase
MPSTVTPDLFRRRETHFVLWRSRNAEPAPRLIIGKLKPGNPPTLIDRRAFDLKLSATAPDLWEIPAAECDLVEGEVYHYWFEVQDSNPYKPVHPRILCTDPTAWTVDWRLLAPRVNEASFGEDDRDPAAVVKFNNGRLLPCDPGGETVDWAGDKSLEALPANNRLVIYELPTAWSRIGATGNTEVSVGTFRDVVSLIEAGANAANFLGTAALDVGRAHLLDLGANALELLPPADSFVDREWGYATSNYFAPDHDLGFPKVNLSPTSNTDLVRLIKTCHGHGVRFFADMVMAFATRYAYQNVNFLDFHVQANSGDPEEFNHGIRREGFGGDLFKYNFLTESYDPISGETKTLVPARALMITHLARWMLDFRIDGIRMDSIPNIGNYDFVEEFKNSARHLWQTRWDEQGHVPAGAGERFLVVGEDLGVSLDWITQNRLDGLWNEIFKRMVRCAILGQSDESEPSFEWTVRKLIDCRLLGFRDGAQAINYVTSHDVEGFRNERLFNFLNNNGVVETERRIKLAFVCLLTAVGIPMIFAGEEFADQHDLPVRHPEKQVDPVNFDRLEDDWRRRIFQYVSRLVKLRTSYDALAVNDTHFIHADFAEGKRVIAWKRGQDSSGKLIVVVANFSDYETPAPFSPGAEYVVPNWPATPAGKRWREVTQDRDVPAEWVGREPIFPWEAKAYALF